MGWTLAFGNNADKTKNRRRVTPLVLLIFFFFAQTGSGVTETREHTAHVHGIGKLNVAQEGNELMIELISPAANIVGFEYAPENERQRKAAQEAAKLLENGGKLFVMSAGAHCTLHEVHIEGDIFHGHQTTKADHHHDHKETHTHGKHHHGKEDVHSDVRATYRYTCGAPQRLKAMDVRLFELFPGMEKLEVQLLSSKGQTAAELDAREHTIPF